MCLQALLSFIDYQINIALVYLTTYVSYPKTGTLFFPESPKLSSAIFFTI